MLGVVDSKGMKPILVLRYLSKIEYALVSTFNNRRRIALLVLMRIFPENSSKSFLHLAAFRPSISSSIVLQAELSENSPETPANRVVTSWASKGIECVRSCDHDNTVKSPKEYFTPLRWPPFLCLLLHHGRRDVIWTYSIGRRGTCGYVTEISDGVESREANWTFAPPRKRLFPRAKFSSGWLASSEWWESGSGINRQKVRIPGIACNDASTHGKFIVKASDE